MTRTAILFFLFTAFIFACKDKAPTETNVPIVDSTQNQDTAKAELIHIDSSMLFTVDDYPVTYDMFKNIDPENPGREIKSGDTRSVDKVWFGNDELKQTLVLEVYTDGFRNIFYHFYNDDIPQPLIDQMELHIESGDTANIQQKVKAFDGFVKKTKKISQQYFTTQKGFRLGDDKQKAITVYGDPHQVSTYGNVEILDWAFFGDQFDISKAEYNGKPIAKDNYGHQVRMFFRNGKLIAMILHNDIP